jgi:hypothetical protein
MTPSTLGVDSLRLPTVSVMNATVSIIGAVGLLIVFVLIAANNRRSKNNNR